MRTIFHIISLHNLYTKPLYKLKVLWYNILCKVVSTLQKNRKGGNTMKKLFDVLNGLGVVKNAKGDKVEQKQSRAIKNDLIDGFIEMLSPDFEIMYDEKDSPVVMLDNGLVIGFDFIIKKLDSQVFAEKQEKAE